MKKSGDTTIRVDCPCCGSTLTIDAGGGTVREWKEAQDPRKTADLKDAGKLLREEKARVEARYQEIVKADKEKSASMEKKFKEFLEKSQGEPVTKPLRDVDLD
jgi:arginyl-tRNA--protein-N-Asp/Glu arginylyltransferase